MRQIFTANLRWLIGSWAVLATFWMLAGHFGFHANWIDALNFPILFLGGVIVGSFAQSWIAQIKSPTND